MPPATTSSPTGDGCAQRGHVAPGAAHGAHARGGRMYCLGLRRGVGQRLGKGWAENRPRAPVYLCRAVDQNHIKTVSAFDGCQLAAHGSTLRPHPPRNPHRSYTRRRPTGGPAAELEAFEAPPMLASAAARRHSVTTSRRRAAPVPPQVIGQRRPRDIRSRDAATLCQPQDRAPVVGAHVHRTPHVTAGERRAFRRAQPRPVVVALVDVERRRSPRPGWRARPVRTAPSALAHGRLRSRSPCSGSRDRKA